MDLRICVHTSEHQHSPHSPARRSGFDVAPGTHLTGRLLTDAPRSLASPTMLVSVISRVRLSQATFGGTQSIAGRQRHTTANTSTTTLQPTASLATNTHTQGLLLIRTSAVDPPSLAGNSFESSSHAPLLLILTTDLRPPLRCNRPIAERHWRTGGHQGRRAADNHGSPAPTNVCISLIPSGICDHIDRTTCARIPLQQGANIPTAIALALPCAPMHHSAPSSQPFWPLHNHSSSCFPSSHPTFTSLELCSR